MTCSFNAHFQDWGEEKIKSVIRQICGLNSRSKLSKYTIVIRDTENASQLEECTPAGKGYIMYVAWSGMSVKGITVTVLASQDCKNDNLLDYNTLANNVLQINVRHD